MYLVTSSIEIAASPETVRAKFLDFPSIPTYHPNGFFKFITPNNPDKPIEAGDKFSAKIELSALNPIIVENSPAAFRWGGSIPYIFTGYHAWRFNPSTKTPGGTTLVQEEEFSGLFSFVMGDGYVARWIGITEKTKNGFARFNRDLKAFSEGTTSG